MKSGGQMLVFWKERLVFLAVPKTGSSAYAAALAPHASQVISAPPELKHAPLYRYNRFIRPMYARVCGEEPEVMAVVREPVDWLGSWFRYRQREALVGQPTSTRGLSFEAFVQDYLHGQRPPHAEVGAQAKFLEPQKNGTRVQHLFRYENLARLDAFLAARLGVEVTVGRQNVSPPAPLTLSAETRARLERKHAADFELWASIH